MLSLNQVLAEQIVHFEVRVHTLENILPLCGAFRAEKHSIRHGVEQVKKLPLLLLAGSRFEEEASSSFHVNVDGCLHDQRAACRHDQAINNVVVVTLVVAVED